MRGSNAILWSVGLTELDQKKWDREVDIVGESIVNENCEWQWEWTFKIRIKDESNVELKQEPIEEEVPMRRLIGREVDSGDGYNANRSTAWSLIASRKVTFKIAFTQEVYGESDKLRDQNPSCSKVAKRFKCQQFEYATNEGYLNVHMRIGWKTIWMRTIVQAFHVIWWRIKSEICHNWKTRFARSYVKTHRWKAKPMKSILKSLF